MNIKNYLNTLVLATFGTASVILLSTSCELTEDLFDTEAGKLVGEWSCDEDSELYKSTSEIYSVYISLDAEAENGIIIDNFYQLGDVGVKATVSGIAVYISTQTIEGGFTVAGSGTISPNSREIEWSYTVHYRIYPLSKFFTENKYAYHKTGISECFQEFQKVTPDISNHFYRRFNFVAHSRHDDRIRTSGPQVVGRYKDRTPHYLPKWLS